MPDDAIGYVFIDKAATMSITVLNLTEASALLRTINKRDIKDVRAIDLDLALVLESGHKIIISRGAVAAVNSPQLILEFADGDIALGDVFEKLNHIEVPADAAVTVTSKEITRYGIKRVVKPKVARNKQDQEADQDKKDEEDSAKSDADEARPAESLAGHDGSGGSDIPARKFTSGKGSSSSLALQELADAPTDAGSSKGGISWPVIAGGLGLLAAAGGGGGGGGGSGGGSGAGAGAGSGGGVATTLSGAAALGPLNNATITAYDAEGRVIGKAVPVINGRYTLVLDQSGYKGLILLAIRDNTPGVRDNYADEASVSITDLGSTVLRLDSGKLANDGITTDGTVRIDNLEPGASWEYSLDSGATWSTTGISGNTVNFTDNGARRSLQVRQTDRAGNVSDASAKLAFTVDTTAPRAPRLALVTNSSGDEAILGGFKRNGMDQYKLDPDIETSITNYGLANIGVLYELNAGATSGRPVVRVGYDGSRSAEGDVIGLYEGDRLVGSKILTAGDVGAGQRAMEVTVFQSLSAGAHDLVARYTDTAGNVVNSGSMRVTVAAGAAPVTLTDLRVHGSQQSVADAKVLGQSDTTYATISDQDTRFGSGHGLRGPVFVGKVGGGAASDRYLVTIQMGGKILAFEEVGAGDFSIGIPAGSLAPGYYQDLSISASVLTPGARLGQTTTTQGLKLGWYWAAQAGTAIMGGKGNDELVVGAAADASVGTLVQTGAGDDTITVGSFGKLTGLKATVSDFVVGVDKVKVFGQVASTEFVKSYVTASNLNGSTHLQIDLDGGGPGKLYYQLTLQGVNYNPANVGSIFGL